jgi:hypothetical protein
MTYNTDPKSTTEFHDHPVNTDGSDRAVNIDGDALRAVGTNSEEIDKGYWKSPKFLGSCIAIILLANNLFWGYAVPVSIYLMIAE